MYLLHKSLKKAASFSKKILCSDFIGNSSHKTVILVKNESLEFYELNENGKLIFINEILLFCCIQQIQIYFYNKALLCISSGGCITILEVTKGSKEGNRDNPTTNPTTSNTYNITPFDTFIYGHTTTSIGYYFEISGDCFSVGSVNGDFIFTDYKNLKFKNSLKYKSNSIIYNYKAIKGLSNYFCMLERKRGDSIVEERGRRKDNIVDSIVDRVVDKKRGDIIVEERGRRKGNIVDSMVDRVMDKKRGDSIVKEGGGRGDNIVDSIVDEKGGDSKDENIYLKNNRGYYNDSSNTNPTNTDAMSIRIVEYIEDIIIVRNVVSVMRCTYNIFMYENMYWMSVSKKEVCVFYGWRCVWREEIFFSNFFVCGSEIVMKNKKSFVLVVDEKGNVYNIEIRGVNSKDIDLEGVSNRDTSYKGVNTNSSKLEGVNTNSSKLEGVNDKDVDIRGVSNSSNLKGDNYKDSSYKGVSSNSTNKQQGVSSRINEQQGVNLLIYFYDKIGSVKDIFIHPMGFLISMGDRDYNCVYHIKGVKGHLVCDIKGVNTKSSTLEGVSTNNSYKGVSTDISLQHSVTGNLFLTHKIDGYFPIKNVFLYFTEKCKNIFLTKDGNFYKYSLKSPLIRTEDSIISFINAVYNQSDIDREVIDREIDRNIDREVIDREIDRNIDREVIDREVIDRRIDREVIDRRIDSDTTDYINIDSRNTSRDTKNSSNLSTHLKNIFFFIYSFIVVTDTSIKYFENNFLKSFSLKFRKNIKEIKKIKDLIVVMTSKEIDMYCDVGREVYSGNTNAYTHSTNPTTLTILYNSYTSTDTSIVLSYNNEIQIYIFDTNLPKKYILKKINLEFKIIYLQIYSNYLFLCTGLSVIRIFNIFSKKYVFIQIFKNNIIEIKIINNKLYVLDDKGIISIFNIESSTRDNSRRGNMDRDNNRRGNMDRDNSRRDNIDRDNSTRDNIDRDDSRRDNMDRDNSSKDNTKIDTNIDNTNIKIDISIDMTLSIPRYVRIGNITNIHYYGTESLLLAKNIFYLEIENEFKKLKIEYEKVFNFKDKIVILKDNFLVSYAVRRKEEYVLERIVEEIDDRVEEIDDRVEEIDDRVEEIDDRVEEIDDRVEEIGDRVEEDGDRVEEDGDRVEEIGDRVEEDGDRVEEIDDRVEEDGDRVEEDGDRVEEDGDRVEEDGDRIDDRIATLFYKLDITMYRLVGESCMVRQVSINKYEIMYFDEEKEIFSRNVNFFKENIFIEDFIDINIVGEYTVVLYRVCGEMSNTDCKDKESRGKDNKGKDENKESRDKYNKDNKCKDNKGETSNANINNIFMIRIYKEKMVLFDYKINGECTSMCCYSNKIFIGIKEEVENPCYRVLINGIGVSTPLSTHLVIPRIQKHFLILFEIGKKSLLIKNKIEFKSQIISIKLNIKYIFIITKRNSLIIYNIDLLTPVIQDITHKHLIYLECIKTDTILCSDKLGNIFVYKIVLEGDRCGRDNTSSSNTGNTELKTLISYYVGDTVIKVRSTNSKIYYFTSSHKFGVFYYLNEKEFNLYEMLEEEICNRQKCFNNYSKYYDRFYCRKSVVDKEYLKKFYLFNEKDKVSISCLLASEVGSIEMLIERY